MNSGSRTVVIRVEGFVQGVGFRISTRREADRLGIHAEPVNMRDGSVRIEATGAPAAIDRLIVWCHEGPPDAQVSEVRVVEDSARSTP